MVTELGISLSGDKNALVMALVDDADTLEQDFGYLPFAQRPDIQAHEVSQNHPPRPTR